MPARDPLGVRFLPRQVVSVSDGARKKGSATVPDVLTERQTIRYGKYRSMGNLPIQQKRSWFVVDVLLTRIEAGSPFVDLQVLKVLLPSTSY